MPGSLPARCGDCGAPAGPIKGDKLERWAIEHFPDCPTLQERAAGVDVVATGSHTSPRRCPKCHSAMTRNHDQGSDTLTDNCTGAMCGVTVAVERAPDHVREVLPPDPTSPAAAFDAIAAMPGAQVFEVPYPGEGQLCPSCQQPVKPENSEEYVLNGSELYHRPCWDDAKEKL
jgi:hypothetical protein